MTVSPTSTDVIVDGTDRLSVPSDGGATSYGGIGLSSSRTAVSAAWPVFAGLVVDPMEDLPNVRSGVGVPVGG
jgi:hypothetical protein